jgi:hypothetical protein
MASSARKRKRRRPRAPAAPANPAARKPARPEEERGRPAPPDRPPAPWGRFPLVELVVLLSIGFLVAGFLVQGTRGITMIIAGVTLGSLAGLELSIREHFAGYRSHTTVLAGVPAVLVAGVGFFVLPGGWSQGAALATAAVIFGVAFYLLREAFKRRSGGLGFR